MVNIFGLSKFVISQNINKQQTDFKFKVRQTGSMATLSVSSVISTAVSCLKYSCSDAELLSLDGPRHVQHLFPMSWRTPVCQKSPAGVRGISTVL